MIREIPSLSFTQALNASINKIMQVRGRARRSEFWWTMLLVFIATIVVPPIGLIMFILAIPLVFRRLHDAGRSGWWWGVNIFLLLASITYSIYSPAFMMLFMMIGMMIGMFYQLVLLALCCIDSERHTNKYGPSPKYVEVADNVDNADANGSAAQDVSSGNVTEEQSQPV